MCLLGHSVTASILTQENAKPTLPEEVGKPVREVEKVVHKHFPERAVKKEKLEDEIDEELKALLESSRKFAGEKIRRCTLKKSSRTISARKKNKKRSLGPHETRAKNYRARDDSKSGASM